jgi:hypothetical protein
VQTYEYVRMQVLVSALVQVDGQVYRICQHMYLLLQVFVERERER